MPSTKFVVSTIVLTVQIDLIYSGQLKLTVALTGDTMLHKRKSLTALFGLMFLFLVNMSSGNIYQSYAQETPADCNLTVRQNLSAVILNGTTGQITNSSDECSYQVGAAAYKKFDAVIRNQEYFDGAIRELLPNQTIQIDLEVPSCAYQFDVFHGDLLKSLNDQKYGSRLLDAYHLGGDNYCEPPQLACTIIGASVLDNQNVFSSILLKTENIYSLGTKSNNHITHGLTFHTGSNILYGLIEDLSTESYLLYEIDRYSGQKTLVTNLELTTYEGDLTGLSINPVQNSFWSILDKQSLVEIDIDSGEITKEISLEKSVTGLVWSLDGGLLYLTDGTKLIAYNTSKNSYSIVEEELGEEIESLTIKPDGLLIWNQNLDQNMLISGYNPQENQIVWQSRLRSQFDQTESIAYPPDCGNLSPGGQASIIQSVEVSQSEVCIGESVFVDVETLHPESPIKEVDVSINGRPGSSQHFQFSGESGPRVISVLANTAEDFTDIQEVSVNLIECADQPAFPILSAQMNKYKPLTVDFDLVNRDEIVEEGVKFQWNLGNGQSIETPKPFLSYDFSDSIDRNKSFSTFDISLAVISPSSEPRTVERTITVWDLYSTSKSQGLIRPVVTNEDSIFENETNYIGRFQIENFEPEKILFTSNEIELQSCKSELGSQFLPKQNINLELSASGKSNHSLTLSKSAVDANICSIGFHLQGSTESNIDAYASVFFDIKQNPFLTRRVVDSQFVDLLNSLVSQGLVKNEFEITEEEFFDLVRSGVISDTQNISQFADTRAFLPKTANLSRELAFMNNIGDPCDPSDPPPRPGVSCQATGEWIFVGPHIKNARKGDIILSAGCGMIGDLLRNVSPPQRYSHTGIMTQNFTELRHSTAVESRYRDYPEGVFGEPTDAFNVDVMRYGWPGTITQSIDEAFNGDSAIDPENGKQYEFSGFSANRVRCGDDVEITYPAVVKPPPGHSPEIRAILESIADQALTINGHYRFYSYTDASISLDPDMGYYAPNRPSWWASGTVPTVCTSFIWTAAQQLGINLEGDVLESEDVQNGAETDVGTLDGLYLYQVDERVNAGNWLYSHVYNVAAEEGGLLGSITNPFTDARDDIANQIVNCFANDTCDKDSDAWKNAGYGRAISPDNMLFWDKPEDGGVYGYHEELVYRQGGLQAVTTWQPSEGNGTLEGTVTLNGEVVPNASVSYLGLEVFTDQNGYFKDELVPSGTYPIAAAIMIDGVFYSTESQPLSFTVTANQTTTVNLRLKPPLSSLRQVVIQGNLFIRDDDWPDSDDTGNFPIFRSERIDTSDLNKMKTVQFDRCVDEVKIDIKFDLKLGNDNQTIEVDTLGILYEDDGFIIINPGDCEGGDNNDSTRDSYSVGPDDGFVKRLYMEDSGDEGDFNYTIENGRQTRMATQFLNKDGGVIETESLSVIIAPDLIDGSAEISVYQLPTQADKNELLFEIVAAGENNKQLRTAEHDSNLELVFASPNIIEAPSLYRYQVYYWDEVEWAPLPTKEDRSTGELVVQTESLGVFKVKPVVRDSAYQLYLPYLSK